MVKVAITEDSAYWVQNDTFWYCPVIDGQVIKEHAAPIDTNALSNDQVQSLFVILDRLEEE